MSLRKFLLSPQDTKKINEMSKKRKTVVPQSHWIPDGLFKQIQKNMPVACVDLLVLRKLSPGLGSFKLGPGKQKNGGLEVLLIKRKIFPEEGKWCLIGGRVFKGEYTKDTIKRQAKEELGVSVKIIPPWNENAPFAVFNDPVSDKQKHFVVLTYPVAITTGKLNAIGPEFSEAKWFPLNKLPPASTFGFHHNKVLAMLSDYAKAKSIML